MKNVVRGLVALAAVGLFAGFETSNAEAAWGYGNSSCCSGGYGWGGGYQRAGLFRGRSYGWGSTACCDPCSSIYTTSYVSNSSGCCGGGVYYGPSSNVQPDYAPQAPGNTSPPPIPSQNSAGPQSDVPPPPSPDAFPQNNSPAGGESPPTPPGASNPSSTDAASLPVTSDGQGS